MALLKFTEILDADDFKTMDVEVPEWGGTVRIRNLTGAERDAWESENIKYDNKSGKNSPNLVNLRARLIAKCAINEDGTPLFTSKRAVEMLGSKASSALDRLFSACQELNAITDEDVEELVEDFDNDQSENSTSA